MANLINKWREYEAGTLIPPVVVQHDYDGTEHLVWVWTGTRIIGPLSRNVFDETDIMNAVLVLEQTSQTVGDE